MNFPYQCFQYFIYASILLTTLNIAQAKVSLKEKILNEIKGPNHKLDLAFRGELRLNTPQNKGSSLFQLFLGYSNNNDVYKIDTSIKYFNEVQKFSFSLSEAYFKMQNKTNYFTFGRKIIPWHMNEKFWQLGHLNSVRSYTLLDEKQEGLIGMYYGKKIHKNIRFNVFFSYLYLPQLNPGFDTKDGVIINRTDWGVVYPTQAIVSGGQLHDIKYFIKDRPISDIIFQKSFGLRIGYYSKKYDFNLFSIYKPESKIRVNVDFAPDVFLNIIVDVEPEVNHHLVTGLESKIKFKNSMLVSGIVDVDPKASIGRDLDLLTIKQREKKQFEFQFFAYQPIYERERYLHSTYYFKSSIVNGQLSYIYYLTEHSSGNDTFSTSAIKWSNAFGFTLDKVLLDWWYATVSFKYDFLKYDNLLKIENNFKYKDFLLKFGIQLLKAPKNGSYWSSFRSNDSVYLKTTYIL